MIGGCPRGELGQHVSLTADGYRDGLCTGHGQIAGNLERADRAAGDQDAQPTKAAGILILRGVRDAARTGECCQARHRRQRPALERARGDYHVRERPFARRCAHQPAPAATAPLEPHDRRPQPQPRCQREPLRVGAQVFANGLVRGVDVRAVRMRQIAERGQDPARIGAHRRPDTTVRAVSAPLASYRGPLFEQHRLEPFGRQIARRRQSGRAGADDSDLSHDSRRSSHLAPWRLPRRATIRCECRQAQSWSATAYSEPPWPICPPHRFRSARGEDVLMLRVTYHQRWRWSGAHRELEPDDPRRDRDERYRPVGVAARRTSLFHSPKSNVTRRTGAA